MGLLCGGGGLFCVQPTLKPLPWEPFPLSACPGLLFIMADSVFIFDVKLKVAEVVRSKEVH